MVNFTKQQKLTMGALIGIGLLNPGSVAVLDEYFKLFYTGVFLACGGWVIAFVLYKALKPETLKIPAKTKKSSKTAYIET